jgi:hypothetical protein
MPCPAASPRPPPHTHTHTHTCNTRTPTYTQFLGQFLPSSRAAREELSVDWGAPKARGLSMTELAARVEAGLAARQWFVTGALHVSAG